MTGWLVVNYYLNNIRFDELYESFDNAARKLGINLIKKANSELMGELVIGGLGGRTGFETVMTYDKSGSKQVLSLDQNISEFDLPLAYNRPDFVLFWDKDVKLARLMETMGFKVYNSADAIECCDDKARTNIALAGSGIHMPKTFISPLTYFDDGLDGSEFVESVESQIPYPMVVKECMGSFGEQVSLAYDRTELLRMVKAKGRIPFIIQEFISTSVGRDVRVYVAGGQAKAAIMRYNEKDFRANYVDGAGMKAYTPSDAQIEMAVNVAKLLGLDFGGVDILFGENDEPIFCEANSNAHFKKLHTVTGVDMAEEILKCVIEKC